MPLPINIKELITGNVIKSEQVNTIDFRNSRIGDFLVTLFPHPLAVLEKQANQPASK